MIFMVKYFFDNMKFSETKRNDLASNLTKDKVIYKIKPEERKEEI